MSVSLSDNLDEVAKRVRAAPHTMLYCDFDGALTPAYEYPLAANLSPDVRTCVADLAASKMMTVTVITGQPAGELRANMEIPGLIVAGNHGLEIAGPGWEHVEPAVAELTPGICALANSLSRNLETVTGARVENKQLSIGVHYGEVAPDQLETVRSAIHGAIAASSHPFVLTSGRWMYDIRPRVYWNKGNMVNWIAGKIGRTDALVLFVGGDPTDEDAFAALPDGVTIRVGAGVETAAMYHIDDPDGVRQFLIWLRGFLRKR